LSCIHLPNHGLTSMSSACNQTRPLFNSPYRHADPSSPA
jgi:hypothetical protein